MTIEALPISQLRFDATVLPALATVKLSAIVDVCGVTKSTASNWRTGKVRPHPSHWSALAELVAMTPEGSR